jgi:hypothetical protein
MLIRQATKSARESWRMDRTWVRPAAPASRAAIRGCGRPAGARACWIIRGASIRIALFSEAVRPRRGATRPRPIFAVPAMWKSSETPRRRRLNFDPLESRQLLNGGDFPAPRPEMAPISSGSTIGTLWVGGYEGGVGGWGNPAPSAGPATWGALSLVEQHDAYLHSGDPGASGLTFIVDSPWGAAGSDRSFAAAASTAPNSGSTAQPGSPSQPTATAASVIGSNPAGSATGGWMSGTSAGGAAANSSLGSSAAGGNPGQPGGPGSGGFDPDAFSGQPQMQNQAPPPLSTNTQPIPLSMIFNGMRDRAEAQQPWTGLAAPLNAAPGPGPPGVQFLAPAAANPGAALVGSSQAQQAPPAGAALSAQMHVIAGDTDGPSGDRTVSLAIGSMTRGVADPARGGQASGRSVLATTLWQPGVASSTSESAAATPGSDEAAPSPIGADLIAEALPFAGDSLERTLEEFVRQLRAVDVAGIAIRGPTPIVVASLAIASAAASAVVVREVVRRRTGRRNGLRLVDSLGRELALSFPELPRSWSEKH